MDLLNRFKDYIKKEELIEKGESILLGVSGGPDSMTMFDLFYRIKEEYNLKLVVFHLNHMFRQEAVQEAVFVKNVAEKYGLEAIIEEFDVPKFILKYGYSPEEGARKVRFQLLAKWAVKYNIKKVAMAHNKDDLVETVFLNFFRGTGLKGLSGIAPLSKIEQLTIIHPLLDILRPEIENYCRERNLNPRYDRTNKEILYTRNKIRNKIIPKIEMEINPGLKEVISRMAVNIREEEEYLANLAYKHFQKCLLKKQSKRLVLSIEMLIKEDRVLRKRIIKNALQELQGGVRDLYTVHYQAIDELILLGQTGKVISLKDNLQIRRSYGELIFEKDYKQEKKKNILSRLDIPGEAEWGDYLIKATILDREDNWRKIAANRKICLCDLGKIDSPLIIRNREKGDLFYPFGLNGSKKLKDFFIDEKIPVTKRDNIPIVVDNSGDIIWIAGYRVDDRFKVDKDTENILKMKINYLGGD